MNSRCAWVTLYGLSSICACGPTTQQVALRALTSNVQNLEGRQQQNERRLAALDEKLILLSAHQVAPTTPAASRTTVPEGGISIADGRAVPAPRPAQRPARAELAKVAPPAAEPAPAAAAELPPQLRRALETYRRGALQLAFKQLNAFLLRQPRHAAADTARYWMGECKREAGDHMASVAQFARLEREHPRSAKAPDALLKMGLAFEKLAAPSEAEATYRRLIKKFPRSAAAELASARLSQAVAGGPASGSEDDHGR